MAYGYYFKSSFIVDRDNRLDYTSHILITLMHIIYKMIYDQLAANESIIKRSAKKVPEISRKDLNLKIQEYLDSGGVITKLKTDDQYYLTMKVNTSNYSSRGSISDSHSSIYLD